MSTPDLGRHGQWASDAPKSYVLSGKIMLTVIIILFAVVIFLVFLHLYARWYLLRARRRYLERRRNRRQRATQLIFYVDPNNPNATVTIPTRGLAAEVLNSLPVFFYSKNDAAGESGPMECAVCLSEFEENEKGRNLPKCNHSFHTECIDMWFELHSTCPLCRSPVDLVALPESGNNPPDIIISVRGESSDSETGVPESSCGFCPTCQHEGDQRGTTSLAGRRKGFDMVVDVPKRSESDGELRLNSPASSGFKSPGSRLYSLKRILSMNRKGTGVGVSPSSGVGPSYGSVGNESDIESGRYELTQMHTRVPTPRYRSNSQINADVIIEDVRKQG